MPASVDRPGPVLCYDAECGLCRRIVRLLYWLDGDARLRFAPLQGGAAQAYLRTHGLPAEDFDSLVFVPDWARRERPEFLLRTDGAMAALRVCGRGGAVLAALLAVWPRAWRESGYREVARVRRRIWGARLGRLPDVPERFLS